jgi:hypothetical protein
MKISLALILFAAPAVRAADFVPLDAKPGQWEATVTIQMSGMPQARQMPQLTPEQMAKIPPAQRAQLEAMMAGKPMTNVSKSCVEKQDMTHLPTGMDQQNCTNTIVSSTSSKLVLKQVCDRNGLKTNATVTVEAVNSENMKFSIVADAVGADGKGGPANIQGTSRWLGPVCTEGANVKK